MDEGLMAGTKKRVLYPALTCTFFCGIIHFINLSKSLQISPKSFSIIALILDVLYFLAIHWSIVDKTFHFISKSNWPQHWQTSCSSLNKNAICIYDRFSIQSLSTVNRWNLFKVLSISVLRSSETERISLGNWVGKQKHR